MVDAEGPTDGRSWDEGPTGTQLAQAGAAAFGDPIGAVREVTGQVLIVHRDGTSEPAAIGLPVFANDIVATGPEGAIEVLFLDGTTFSLGENGQMRLDSLIFDPAGSGNGLDATVVKGSFIFITGQVGSAQGEGVSIDTPAGTIGIRGTSGGIARDPQTGLWTITLFRDPDGTLSRFTFTNPAGVRLLDQEFETTQVPNRQTTPAQTIVLTPDQAVSIFAGALRMLQEQYPDLQPPEQRGELDNIIPEAGPEQFAVESGLLLLTPEALAELYGLDALGGALAELLLGGALGDGGFLGLGGNGSSGIQGSTSTFLPVDEPSGPAPPIDDDPEPNVVPENIGPGTPVGITALADDPRFTGPVTYTLLDDAGGRFVIDPDTGVVTVADGADLNFEENATYTIVVQASDGVRTSSAPMTIMIANVNEPPTEISLSNAAVPENAPGAVIGTLSAVDPDAGDSFTFAVSDDRFEVVGNQLKLRDGVSLDHEPAGVVTVDVTVTDAGGESFTQTFEITVTDVNEAPVAADDEYGVDEDGTLSVGAAEGLLANDSDVDGDVLAAVLVSGPANGTLAFNADGSFTYTPAENFNGTDSFTYKVTDGTTDSDVATVTINVAPQNDAPVATGDSYAVAEDGTLIVAAAGVLANDADIDGDTLSAVLVAGPENGTLTLNADGSFTYTPAENFNGTDAFTYRANDGTADSDPVTVTITVGAVNDPPVAQDDEYAVDEDGTLTVAALAGVLANDKDVDGDTLSAVLVSGPENGTLELNADGSFTYTPDANFNGTDTFTYEANDGAADSDPVTVTITVGAVNDPPVAQDDSYETVEDKALVIAGPGVLANDTDIDGDDLSAVLVNGPLHGTLILNADGSFTYTPEENFNGTDTFTYKANDGTADGNVATVTLTIGAQNDPPAAVGDAYEITEDGTLIVGAAAGVLANDQDVEGDALAAVLVDGPDNGQLTLNADGSFTYTPNADFKGTDSFTYKASDGTTEGNTATVTLTVTAVNDPPVSADDAYQVAEDGKLIVGAAGVLANDTDVDGDDLAAVLVNGPLHGQLTLNADGSFTYAPDADFNGTDTFTYKANDGTADGNVATVTLTVTAQNDAPVSVDDAYLVAEDDTLIVGAAGVLTNDTDVEGDALAAVLVQGPANGQLTLNPDGSFTYTPDANFNGTDTFTYKANDGSADSGVATVTITVDPRNDSPVAVDDSYTVGEDGTLTVAAAGVLVNDTDIDDDALSAVLVSGPANGTLTLNEDGSFTYTPNADFNGTDTFTYKANDGTANGNVATVTITVDPQNDAPVAADDSYSVAEDGTLTVAAAAGVLANDTDIDGDDLSAVLVSGPENGTLALNADGSFTYTPDEDFNGTDTFTYKANDGSADGNVATVTITVDPRNDAPVATGDSYTADEDGTLIVAAAGVLANDTDIDGDDLSAVLVSGPANGALTLNPDGSFTYTPDEDFNGTDTFTYKANDGATDSGTATVTITVNPRNDAPVATDDSYTVDEDGKLTIAAAGVLANDTDIDGDSLSAVLVSGPANGTLALNPDGSFTYTPDADFNGTDTFTYKANDGTADGNVATVTITVDPQNDAPVATGDSYTVDEDGTLTVAAAGVLANDADIDGDALSAVLVSGPANGTLTLNPDGSFTYTPDANFNGADTFTYKANDGTADGNVATVTITVDPQNDAPAAVDDSYTVAEDGTLTVAAAGVLANDTDIDGDDLSAVLVSGPANGTLTLNPDGSFTYTPDANFNGTDTFTYKANDGSADGNVATVTITVDPQNDAPVAVDDSYTVDEDGKLTVAAAGVLANDTDIDSDSLSAVLVSGPANGTLVLNANGSFTYTPDEDFNGTDTFTYKADDGTADSGVATVTIEVAPQNDAPVAVGDAYAVDEDGTLTVAAQAGLLANDGDVDGDDLSAVLVSGPENGTLVLNADGSFTYTPEADFNGTDTFTYKANDGAADSDVAAVTITVRPQNDAPVAAADAYAVAEDGTLTVAANAGVLANDTDIDGDKLTAALVDGPDNGKLVLNSDGSFVYTPDADFNGTDSFIYQASDGSAASEPVTVTLTVTPVNDPPVAEDDSYDLGQGGSLTVPAKSGVLANDTDIDGGTLSVALASGPAHGALSLNADGSFTYTPDPSYDGLDSFTYTVSDGLGGTDTGTVTMNIADAAPTAVDDVVETADAARQTIDLVIILDRSGSMEDSPGVAGFSTRLELARAAIAALFEAYQSIADINILIVDFANTADSSGWLASPEAANAYLASLVAGGTTNYTAAIEEAMTAYAGAPAADKTEIYFLSDGVPTAGTSLAATGTVGEWEAFLSDPANHIDTAYAVGIGTGIEAGDPDLADVAFPNGDPENPTVVTDESRLIDTLVGTVANPVSGNVLLNDDFGPDGKGNGGVGLLSITVDGVTYTYAAGQITNDADSVVIAGAVLLIPATSLGGILEFHFDSGDFTYTPPDVDSPQSELFVYTIIDSDGTTGTATLQIDISDSGVVVLDPHTVIGTDKADSLAGADGAVDDIISGGKGADSLAGGDGNDHIQGGADADSLLGGAGIDILIGGAGNDTLDGGAGADVLVGGTGADRIFVGTGDRADGGDGSDTIILTDTVGFLAVQGGGAAAVDLGSASGDVLAFNGGLDLTALANDRILGIETISMLDSIGGAGPDSLSLGAGDVIDIGAGQFDPNGNLPAAPAIRIDGDRGDVLNLEGGGWQQVAADKLPPGYTLYLHDTAAPGVIPDAYVLVQSTVTVTTD